MADFSIKAHDQLPSIQAALSDSKGPVDLTDAISVRFIMRLANGNGQIKVNSPGVIVDKTGGIVRYDWGVSDTDAPGVYNGEWAVQWPGGPQTFPTLTYHQIAVLADLDGA